MNDTKQKIFDVSLDLFSQNGFSSVSIRDICKQVQIKESSVYYHFKNKQAIFDDLLCRFEEIANSMIEQLEKSLLDKQEVFNDNFYMPICNCFFENYLMDEFCNKMIRLLLIEQFNNNTVQKLYDYWIFNEPLKFQSKVFSALIEIGLIKQIDSEYLAFNYYAPIFFLAQRWLFSGKLSEERKNAFRTDAYKHIQLFFQKWGQNNG